MEEKLLSIVVPVYNEEQNLPILHKELCEVFEVLSGFSFEIVLVNDGSADGSWEVIRALAAKDERVMGIDLSRNFGHQAALEAGLQAAKGDVVVMIDADLEQPPSLIPTLVGKWREGYKVVNTSRESNPQSRSLFKRVTSKYFYRFFNMICDITIEPASCDFRLVDRQVLRELLKVHENERYFRGLVAWMGFRSTVVEYKDGVRQNGVTGYSLKKMVNLAYTALTTHSTVPLKAIVAIGLLIVCLSSVLMLGMALVNLLLASHYFSDIAFLVVFIILNNGFILTILGIMSAYLVRIHTSVQGKPNYIIGEITTNIN